MKDANRSGGKIFILLALLILLCIGGSELTACYFFEPELFRQIVQPVKDTASAAAATVTTYGKEVAASAAAFGKSVAASAADCRQQIADSWAACWEEWTAEEPPPPLERQYTSEPTLIDTKTFPETAITELISANGQEILTGGILPVVYFNQTDTAWKDLPYGTDDIGTYGCGPTAMAMAVASLNDTDTDPAQMSALAAELGYWVKYSGSYHSIVNGIAEYYGLTCTPITQYTIAALHHQLLTGKLIVALMGPGHFTDGGHFILLRGITLDGKILVADPSSPERSLTEWEPQVILDELSASRTNGAPLWALSKPLSP